MNEDKVELDPPYGTDDYFALRFSRSPDLAVTRHVIALKRVITSIPMQVSDQGIARLKLAWWQEEISALSRGEVKHPLLSSCLDSAADIAALQASLLRLVEHIDGALASTQPETQDDYFGWFESTYGDLYGLSNNPAHRAAAAALGARLEAARSVLNIREQALSNFVRLPRVVLEQWQCDAYALMSHEPRSRVYEMLRQQLDVGLRQLESALEHSLGVDSTTRILAHLTKQTLIETINDGCRLFERRIELTPLRKLMIAWRRR